MTVIELPMPPSTNGLFVNGRKGRFRSQKYDEWIQEAGWELARQRPAKVIGPVVLTFTFEEPKRKYDISNRLKAPEDLLVSHGIIEADDCSIVRGISARFSESVKGVKIEITSV